MRRTALLTLFAFGCATARPPEADAFLSAAPARVALAEPELELWMEGTHTVDPQESARALEESREALSQAVAGRGLEVSEPEQLLVVRERAIARTGERRSAQAWSTVGIVVGFVVVAVVAILLSRSKSSSGGPRSRHTAVPAVPRGAVGARPAYFAPRRYPPPPPIGVAVGFNVLVPIGPAPPVPWVEPTESRLASRGWFDGDEVELTLELVDPATGDVSWHRTVREGVDPRDPGALSALVDRALAGQAFGQKAPTPAPPKGVLPGPPPPADRTPIGSPSGQQNALKLLG